MSDLVERLRAAGESSTSDVFDLAADEIERLTREVREVMARWEAMCEKQGEALMCTARAEGERDEARAEVVRAHENDCWGTLKGRRYVYGDRKSCLLCRTTLEAKG